MPRLLLDPQHDVLEGQAGIAFGEFLRCDLEAGKRQKLGLDTRGDDLGIDEHAVAIEDDEVWARSWESGDGAWAEGQVAIKRGGIHQAGAGGKLAVAGGATFRRLLLTFPDLPGTDIPKAGMGRKQ